jgi:sensor domain DACNV-containing protein
MSDSAQDTGLVRVVGQSRSPKDLASAVHLELLRRGAGPPPLEVLIELFESMYFASLKTEESKPVLFHIAYVDPQKPDPKPPKAVVHNRWSCVRLSPPIALNSANFVKLAPASDPRTSSFAVYRDSNGQLMVWGLIDQGNSYHDYVNFDSESGPERPGLFQASITGIGHLVAYIGYEKVAELKLNNLVRTAIDVFQSGKIRDALEAGIQSHLESLRTGWPDEFPADSDDGKLSITETWLAALRRLLLRVQSIRHGGAFLMTSSEADKGFLVKHKIAYNRLRTALQRHSVATAQHLVAGEIIAEEYMEKDLEDMPIGLHVDEAIAGYDLEEIQNELGGVIWFISLLTRVDGLVLLNHNLEVRGFGVEITEPDEPSEIYAAGDAWASESFIKRIDYQQYGTRHRSMMRYCAKFPGSVGFVISQDGDVRVMTKVGDRLMVWENIQLQLPKFVSRRKPRRRRGRRLPRPRPSDTGDH